MEERFGNIKQDIANYVYAGTIVFIVLAIVFVIFLFLSIKRRNKMLYEKQNLQQKFRQELLRTQIEMQEQTFNTISQEIHDNVGQVLSLAKVQLNIMEQKEMHSTELITEVKDNIGKAMADLRDIAKSLNSDRIEELELKELIETEFNRINRSGVLQTYLYVKGVEKPVNTQKKLILFRIIQESFQNIFKHAQATIIVLVLKFHEQQLQVLIYDNGKGFDPVQLNKNMKGLGLRNMEMRCKLIHGSLEVESSPGNGTTLKITIPYA